MISLFRSQFKSSREPLIPLVGAAEMSRRAIYRDAVLAFWNSSMSFNKRAIKIFSFLRASNARDSPPPKESMKMAEIIKKSISFQFNQWVYNPSVCMSTFLQFPILHLLLMHLLFMPALICNLIGSFILFFLNQSLFSPQKGNNNSSTFPSFFLPSVKNMPNTFCGHLVLRRRYYGMHFALAVIL